MREIDRRYLLLAILSPVLIGIAIFIPALSGMLGAMIGSSPEFLCEASGGKWGSVENRCVTRACYAAHDCGHWTHPDSWRDRVKLGDDVATVVFWFGEPDRPIGKPDPNGDETYYWSVGMCCGPLPRFSATFHNGRLVALGPIEKTNDP